MKKIILMSLVLALWSAKGSTSGGDLGGGGEMQAAFQLSAQEVEALRAQGNLQAAYATWLRNLSPSEQQQLIDKVFKFHIVPQLQK